MEFSKRLTDHLADLEAFLRRAGDAPAWKEIRVVEDREISHGSVTIIPKKSLHTPSEYGTRFQALVQMGYSWINLVGNGVLNGTLIVSVETPLESSGLAPETVPINLSGPYLNSDGSKRWHLDTMCIVI